VRVFDKKTHELRLEPSISFHTINKYTNEAISQ